MKKIILNKKSFFLLIALIILGLLPLFPYKVYAACTSPSVQWNSSPFINIYVGGGLIKTLQADALGGPDKTIYRNTSLEAVSAAVMNQGCESKFITFTDTLQSWNQDTGQWTAVSDTSVTRAPTAPLNLLWDFSIENPTTPRKYRMKFEASSDLGVTPAAPHYITFWYMPSSLITSNSTLSGTIQVPYYDGVMKPNKTNPSYHLLISPASTSTNTTTRQNSDNQTVGNTTIGANDILIPTSAIQRNTPTTSDPYKITMSINYTLNGLNLSSGTEYVWRLAQQGETVTAFFPGYRFTYNSTSSPSSTSSSVVTKHDELVGNKTQTEIPFNDTTDSIYHISGNLTISGNNGPNPPTHSGVVFVYGNLNITQNYTYGSALTGTVFVVNGNVNINQSVTRIDAVIISNGTICTAYDFVTDSCPGTNIVTSPLTINGSLISIKQPDPTEINPQESIRFRRSLSDNTQAAEIINHQVKYLVILRNLFSDTWQKWSEIP